MLTYSNAHKSSLRAHLPFRHVNGSSRVVCKAYNKEAKDLLPIDRVASTTMAMVGAALVMLHAPNAFAEVEVRNTNPKSSFNLETNYRHMPHDGRWFRPHKRHRWPGPFQSSRSIRSKSGQPL